MSGFAKTACLLTAALLSSLMNAQDAARGQSQFVQSCSFCHGAEATGGGEGPNLMRSTLVRHDDKGDLIGPVIRNGRPAKGMPSIPLTAEQIDDVVAFLHARVKESDRTSPASPGQDFDLRKLLTGSATAGKSYFYGPGKCSGCHSATGDLAHIATKYPPADLQARFLYPESEKPPAVTVLLASGARVSGTLVGKDQFYIGILDEKGWYRSWPSKQVTLIAKDPLAEHLKLLGDYTDADVHNMFAFLETLK